MDYDFFRKINNSFGASSRREVALFEVRREVEGVYGETIDGQPNALVDGVFMPLIVMEYGKVSFDKKNIETFGEYRFNWGSKVSCFGQSWLVTKVNFNQDVKVSGIMQLCNFTLKFQDDDGNIVLEDCIQKAYAMNADGQNIGNVTTVNETIKHLIVQMNQHTLRLRQGKRVYIDIQGVDDPKVYEITHIDRTTGVFGGYGVFDITCRQTEERAGDRPDLMLADYRGDVAPLASVGFCKITCGGKASLRVGGTAKKFTAVFEDADGNEVLDIVPVWELDFSAFPDITDKIIVREQEGNFIRLEACDVSGLVGKSFDLRVSATHDAFGAFESIITVCVEAVIL